jgi:flagellar basal body-associated protein FliL
MSSLAEKVKAEEEEKIPLYKKPWFIVLMVVIVIIVLILLAVGGYLAFRNKKQIKEFGARASESARSSFKNLKRRF